MSDHICIAQDVMGANVKLLKLTNLCSCEIGANTKRQCHEKALKDRHAIQVPGRGADLRPGPLPGTARSDSNTRMFLRHPPGKCDT
jgi:hypothetical protein